MSQPAVSRALQRLRSTLSDPLLVRTSHGYDLSARAASLLPQLNQLLNMAESLIKEPVFDLANSIQTMRFHGPDPEINWFLPRIFERMREQAPHMTLEVRSEPTDHFALLERGEVHFAFSPFRPSANTAQLHGLKLGRLEFVLLMSADNPTAKGRLTIERYSNACHGCISLTGRGVGFREQTLITQGHLAAGSRLHTALFFDQLYVGCQLL